jgi:hypothetical protein
VSRKVLDLVLCNGSKKVVTQGTLSVKMNDSVGLYFRQGDPLARTFFNLVVNSMSIMMKRA